MVFWDPRAREVYKYLFSFVFWDPKGGGVAEVAGRSIFFNVFVLLSMPFLVLELSLLFLFLSIRLMYLLCYIV